MKLQLPLVASLVWFATAGPVMASNDLLNQVDVLYGNSFKGNNGPPLMNCGEVDNLGAGFARSYAGTGYRTSKSNVPGVEDSRGKRPTIFVIDGSMTTCDALKRCAYDAYFVEMLSDSSIALHWQISTATWICAAYYDPIHATEFNVADHDVGVAYGYDDNYV